METLWRTTEGGIHSQHCLDVSRTVKEHRNTQNIWTLNTYIQTQFHNETPLYGFSLNHFIVKKRGLNIKNHSTIQYFWFPSCNSVRLLEVFSICLLHHSPLTTTIITCTILNLVSVFVFILNYYYFFLNILSVKCNKPVWSFWQHLFTF